MFKSYFHLVLHNKVMNKKIKINFIMEGEIEYSLLHIPFYSILEKNKIKLETSLKGVDKVKQVNITANQ